MYSLDPRQQRGAREPARAHQVTTNASGVVPGAIEPPSDRIFAGILLSGQCGKEGEGGAGYGAAETGSGSSASAVGGWSHPRARLDSRDAAEAVRRLDRARADLDAAAAGPQQGRGHAARDGQLTATLQAAVGTLRPHSHMARAGIVGHCHVAKVLAEGTVRAALGERGMAPVRSPDRGADPTECVRIVSRRVLAALRTLFKLHSDSVAPGLRYDSLPCDYTTLLWTAASALGAPPLSGAAAARQPCHRLSTASVLRKVLDDAARAKAWPLVVMCSAVAALEAVTLTDHGASLLCELRVADRPPTTARASTGTAAPATVLNAAGSGTEHDVEARWDRERGVRRAWRVVSGIAPPSATAHTWLGASCGLNPPTADHWVCLLQSLTDVASQAPAAPPDLAAVDPGRPPTCVSVWCGLAARCVAGLLRGSPRCATRGRAFYLTLRPNALAVLVDPSHNPPAADLRAFDAAAEVQAMKQKQHEQQQQQQQKQERQRGRQAQQGGGKGMEEGRGDASHVVLPQRPSSPPTETMPCPELPQVKYPPTSDDDELASQAIPLLSVLRAARSARRRREAHARLYKASALVGLRGPCSLHALEQRVAAALSREMPGDRPAPWASTPPRATYAALRALLSTLLSRRFVVRSGALELPRRARVSQWTTRATGLPFDLCVAAEAVPHPSTLPPAAEARGPIQRTSPTRIGISFVAKRDREGHYGGGGGGGGASSGWCDDISPAAATEAGAEGEAANRAVDAGRAFADLITANTLCSVRLTVTSAGIGRGGSGEGGATACLSRTVGQKVMVVPAMAGAVPPPGARQQQDRAARACAALGCVGCDDSVDNERTAVAVSVARDYLLAPLADSARSRSPEARSPRPATAGARKRPRQPLVCDAGGEEGAGATPAGEVQVEARVQEGDPSSPGKRRRTANGEQGRWEAAESGGGAEGGQDTAGESSSSATAGATGTDSGSRDDGDRAEADVRALQGGGLRRFIPSSATALRLLRHRRALREAGWGVADAGRVSVRLEMTPLLSVELLFTLAALHADAARAGDAAGDADAAVCAGRCHRAGAGPAPFCTAKAVREAERERLEKESGGARAAARVGGDGRATAEAEGQAADALVDLRSLHSSAYRGTSDRVGTLLLAAAARGLSREALRRARLPPRRSLSLLRTFLARSFDLFAQRHVDALANIPSPHLSPILARHDLFVRNEGTVLRLALIKTLRAVACPGNTCRSLRDHLWPCVRLPLLPRRALDAFRAHLYDALWRLCSTPRHEAGGGLDEATCALLCGPLPDVEEMAAPGGLPTTPSTPLEGSPAPQPGSEALHQMRDKALFDCPDPRVAFTVRVVEQLVAEAEAAKAEARHHRTAPGSLHAAHRRGMSSPSRAAVAAALKRGGMDAPAQSELAGVLTLTKTGIFRGQIPEPQAAFRFKPRSYAQQSVTPREEARPESGSAANGPVQPRTART